jgi:uncharacterized membrane protein YgaE (UPF0421/DUF939 family)|tara:strand:+ start:958 stop:1395 length:438 start_codon:yes stop_codon:yes gene_type:complete
MSANVLHKTFFDNTRLVAKRVFNELDKGKRLKLISLTMEDKSELNIDVSLDTTEYIGQLNFSLMRKHLKALLAQIAKLLEEGKRPSVRNNQQNGSQLFNIPGAVVEQGQLNVLMMAWSSKVKGTLEIELMFFEPTQFIEKESAAE